jgi:hypothetical protein
MLLVKKMKETILLTEADYDKKKNNSNAKRRGANTADRCVGNTLLSIHFHQVLAAYY